MARLLSQPVLAQMLGLVAVAMLGPAGLAAGSGDERSARAFLYSALFVGVCATMAALVLGRRRAEGANARAEIGALLACWVLVPVFAAVPLWLITPAVGVAGVVFEMVAAFTTTGGTGYGQLAELPDAVQLWRGLIGWLGGFLTLIAAWVVLAPRRLGGFEIEAATWRMQRADAPRDAALGITTAPFEPRVRRAVRVILPIYAILTVVLGLCLSGTGAGELEASVHAMAILSTSGISPFAEGFAASENLAAEAVAALFLLTAATRLVYADASVIGARRRIERDPEVWMMGALVGIVSATLFVRHWIGSITVELGQTGVPVGEAMWGMLFTVLSFATTTGFVSGYWESAREWSGLANPGLMLLGLAAIGGGAATTAGGIKLIRAYALMRHGLRELERIAQPNSVLGIGVQTRTLLREGPVIVWTFIMLFIIAILTSVLALTAAGLRFETAVVASIAAISNTGPALEMVSESGRSFADLTQTQRMILTVPMIVGRVETLALIALFNPDAWTPRRQLSKGAGKATREPPMSP